MSFPPPSTMNCVSLHEEVGSRKHLPVPRQDADELKKNGSESVQLI